MDASLLILDERGYRAVRFVLDLVDRLGDEHDFDPAELLSLRTKKPLGPFIATVRRALELFEASNTRGRPHAEQCREWGFLP